MNAEDQPDPPGHGFDPSEFDAFVARRPEILEAHAVSGDRDYQLKIAVRAPPTCKKPVGLGANRTRTGFME